MWLNLSFFPHIFFFFYLPIGVFDRVGNRQVPSQIVSQQYHGLQTHFCSPLLDGLHKLVLCLLGIRWEQWSAALSKAQQVQGEDRPVLGESVQVLSPEANATSKAMQQNHGRFGLHVLTAKGQGP